MNAQRIIKKHTFWLYNVHLTVVKTNMKSVSHYSVNVNIAVYKQNNSVQLLKHKKNINYMEINKSSCYFFFQAECKFDS